MPKISIHISCYNRSRMLRECVESFLAQTFQDFEIIIVDDGSLDDLSFVAEMDSRVRFFKQEHGGMAKGLNLAMDKSCGDYIMPFGSDDLALPTLLEETLSELESNPDFDVVYPDKWQQSIHGRIRSKSVQYSHGKDYEKMLEQQYISHGGTLWKKDKCPRYDETVWSAEDWELFLTAMENGVKFKHIPKRLWIYKVGHPREGNTQRQIWGCQRVLERRGYKFNIRTRHGEKNK